MLTMFAVVFSMLATPHVHLPSAASRALDGHFPHWRALRYSRQLYGDQIAAVNKSEEPLIECYLNRDTMPDYVMGIVVGKGTSLTVHFVAMVSQDDSFSVFVLESYHNPRPLTGYLHLYAKNSEITNFGFDDEENVPKTLLHGWNGDEIVCRFDRDCPAIFQTDKNTCHTFIFEQGKFWSFQACD